jgi:hypothetical protein
MPANSFYLNEEYGFSRSAHFSDDTLLRVCKAMMICAGADGLSPAELEYCLGLAHTLGASTASIDELRRFDFEHARLEDFLRADDKFPRRALLYECIRVSRADEVYAESERAAVLDAADLLGIDEDTVVALEGMVEMDQALRRARVRLMHQG